MTGDSAMIESREEILHRLTQVARDKHELEQRCAHYEAEVRRKDAALREIQTLGEHGMKPDYREWLTFHEKVAAIARSALTPARETGETK